MEKKEKIKNIEFIGIFAVLAVMLFNISWSSGGLYGIYKTSIPIYVTLKSNLAYSHHWLDFLFIISGFFLFLTTNFSSSFKEFFTKKVIRLLPVILFALVAIKILSLFGLAPHKKLYDFYNLLFLNGVGFTKAKDWGNLGHTWFVSCLFWSSIFLFYLAKSVSKNILNILMGLFITFSYTIMLSNTTNPLILYNKFLSIGLIRAVGAMAIGYFICEWYKDYKENQTSNKTTTLGLILYSAIELSLFGFIVGNTILHKLDFSSWTILIIAFVAFFVLLLMKKGVLSKILDNNLSSLFGKYAYSLFIVHPIIIAVFRKTWWHNKEFVTTYPLLTIALTGIASIILAIIVHHNVELPATKFLNNLWLNKKEQ